MVAPRHALRGARPNGQTGGGRRCCRATGSTAAGDTPLRPERTQGARLVSGEKPCNQTRRAPIGAPEISRRRRQRATWGKTPPGSGFAAEAGGIDDAAADSAGRGPRRTVADVPMRPPPQRSLRSSSTASRRSLRMNCSLHGTACSSLTGWLREPATTSPGAAGVRHQDRLAFLHAREGLQVGAAAAARQICTACEVSRKRTAFRCSTNCRCSSPCRSFPRGHLVGPGPDGDFLCRL